MHFQVWTWPSWLCFWVCITWTGHGCTCVECKVVTGAAPGQRVVRMLLKRGYAWDVGKSMEYLETMGMACNEADEISSQTIWRIRYMSRSYLISTVRVMCKGLCDLIVSVPLFCIRGLHGRSTWIWQIRVLGHLNACQRLTLGVMPQRLVGVFRMASHCALVLSWVLWLSFWCEIEFL